MAKVFNESAVIKALYAGKPGNPMTPGQAAAFDTAFPNNVNLTWTNAAGTAEIGAIKVNASNGVEVSAVQQLNDASGNELIKFTSVTSAVNEFTVTNSATGNTVGIAATGGDTNIGLTIGGKGTGMLYLGPTTSAGVKFVGDQPILDSSDNEQIKFVKTPVAVNELTITNAATGGNPSLSATGGDTNVAMQLTSKGTGLVLVGGTGTGTSTASAATVSTQKGVVTSESLTTAAGASWDLTLTNTKIAAGNVVVASVQNGTNTQGIPVVGVVTPGSGSAVIQVFNLHASQAFNGTIKVSFMVL